ncbi:Protein of unknown function [Propionibacterium freudenreichii]|uniref:Uncharacterized protein n=1 Tax=Propionibacterium freudenreichii subsp. freudenreichii TaxID=66712 RepID=A0A068VRP9_PROFF|nr:Protein of unknown function [Propionibacterium freudenreichii subsp. freudenreichii]CEG86815.1 Protein of unknown function [Propionibacterium freudenreichii]CEG87634.1 Protein of unknown function [Propionibacterium freudenreichii]CEG89369.1 Protein of unknown function [Propionibacterium freudenreichii]CEG93993.1 Protein of unknown function [Propionibacterium freudenreichii]
MTLPAGPVA